MRSRPVPRSSALAVVFVMLMLIFTVPAGPASATVTVTSHFIYTSPGYGTFVSPINNDATNGEGNATLRHTQLLRRRCLRLRSRHCAYRRHLQLVRRCPVVDCQSRRSDEYCRRIDVQRPGGATGEQQRLRPDRHQRQHPGRRHLHQLAQDERQPERAHTITPNLDPGGSNEFVSDHPIGAYYN